MYVINRHGNREPIILQKIINRIADAATNTVYGRTLNVDINLIALEVLKNLHDNIKTEVLDDITCKIALGYQLKNRDYEKLAARLAINNLIKNTTEYRESSKPGSRFFDHLHGVLAPHIIEFMDKNWDYLKNLICVSDNYRYSHSGFFILKKNYLLRELGKNIIETPAEATLRVAVGVSLSSSFAQVQKTQETLDLSKELKRISKVYTTLTAMSFTYATPVLFNAGCINNQLSSCIIIDADDNLQSIMRMISDSAIAQKYSSGIGMNWTGLRGKNQLIKGTNGVTSGLAPLAEMTDKLGKYIDQGGGKRTGSIAPYVADWHSDLLDVLNLRSIRDTSQAEQYHNLFYAVWCSDLFFKQFETDGMWYFFANAEHQFETRTKEYIINEDLFSREFSREDEQIEDCGKYYTEKYHTTVKTVNLQDTYGSEFEEIYWDLVERKLYVQAMPARKVWEEIIKIQSVAGVPYIVSKDNVNRFRNQNAPIHSLNLCAEVALPTNDSEIGVCNLASINVKKFIFTLANSREKTDQVQKGENICKDKLKQTVKLIVKTLNNIIDINFYPLERARYSNMLRRPIGIGIMGLADALHKLNIVYGSQEAIEFRAHIQELIYYYAVKTSIKLTKFGKLDPQTINESLHPLRYELAGFWNSSNSVFSAQERGSSKWQKLAEQKATYGIRNSVLTCCMPTGSTARIMGSSSSFEPYESNIYRHAAYASEQVIINKYLYKWIDAKNFRKKDTLLKRIVMLSGNIQDLSLNSYGPEMLLSDQEEKYVKLRFRHVDQIPMQGYLDMCIASQAFIDQSQSMNLWSARLSINTFNLYNYGRKAGLKTLCYYHHSESRVKENVCENCVI